VQVWFGELKLSAGAVRGPDAGPAGPDQLSINSARVLQPKQLIRATNGSSLDRGNETNVVTFACSREHGSVAAAEVFLLEHVLPAGTATLKLLATGEGAERYMADAAYQGGQHSYKGVRTFHSYTFTGGAFVAQAP